MEKLNYNDFNKFLVSLGVVLIGLALFIPWLFLKESYYLPLEEEIDKLSTISKSIIESKQKYLLVFSNLIPWVSTTFILSGIFLVIFGLVRWYKKQLLQDKKDALDVIKLEKEIQVMSPNEIIVKALKETREDSLDEILENKELEFGKKTILSQDVHPWKKYIEIERAITDRIININSNIFEVLSNIKVGSSEIDILLKSKNNSYYDKIIEIKYYKSGFRKSFINLIPSNLKSTMEMYRIKTKREASPIVIFVLKEVSDDYQKLKEVNTLLENQTKEWNLGYFQIEFIKENEINSYDITRILNPIKKHATNNS